MDGTGPAARVKAAEHISALRHDDAVGADQIIVGLLNLGMLLVMDLALEKGASADVFAEAGDILRRMSPRLPE